MIVPTAYPDLTEPKIRELRKIGMVIYGNHAIRADRGIHNIDKRIVSVEEIFELQRVPDMKQAEKEYLR